MRALQSWALLVACEGEPPPTAVVLTDLEADVHDTIGSIVVLEWEQDGQAEVLVQYSFDEGLWQGSPARGLGAGAHSELLLGIPYDTEVVLRAVLDGEIQGDEISITTGPLPDGCPTPEVLESDEAGWDPELVWVFTSINDGQNDQGEPYWSLIVDRQGRVVWAVISPSDRVTLQPQVSSDGTALLIDHNSFWGAFDGGAASQVHQVRIDGSVERIWETAGLHHPFTQHPDGTLAWVAADGRDESIVEQGPDGDEVEIWGCRGFHEALGINRYCGSNTLTFLEDSDTYLYSSYSTDSVVVIDRAAGEASHWFGHLDGSWAFDPEDSAFWWQHGPHITESGTLMLSSMLSEDGVELVVREYEMDAETETLTEVWSYGEGEGILGEEMGEAWRLSGGNVLHNYGSASRMREVTPGGEVVWDLQWQAAHDQWLGRSTALDDLYALAPR